MQAEPVLPKVRRPATDAERRALASVLRLRILRLCLYEALTNKELADRLGRDPATVLHHVRTLLNQGFLRSEQSRPGPRGSTEVPYRATGKSWELDFRTPDGSPDLSRVGESDDASGGRGHAGLSDPLAEDWPREGSSIDDSPDGSDIGIRKAPNGTADVLLRTFLEEVAQIPQVELLTTRLGLQLSAEHLDEFNARLRALFDEFVARGPDENGQRWSVFCARHPEP